MPVITYLSKGKTNQVEFEFSVFYIELTSQ